jgi:hypothetical protein
MTRVRAAATVAATLAAMALVSSPAGAYQPATGTITVDPTSGSPGTPFIFSGDGCVSEAGPGLVEVFVFQGESLVTVLLPEFSGIDDEGNWAMGMVPNGFMASEAAVGEWHASATCSDAETGDPIVDYEDATFTVTAPPSPPSPPAPPAPPTPATPQAQPAAPVTARPNFAG